MRFLNWQCPHRAADEAHRWRWSVQAVCLRIYLPPCLLAAMRSCAALGPRAAALVTKQMCGGICWTPEGLWCLYDECTGQQSWLNVFLSWPSFHTMESNLVVERGQGEVVKWQQQTDADVCEAVHSHYYRGTMATRVGEGTLQVVVRKSLRDFLGDWSESGCTEQC